MSDPRKAVPSNFGALGLPTARASAFGTASALWGKLTENQFRAWHDAAKQEKRRRHWPARKRLTPQNLFTEINSQQAFLGLPPFLDPPRRPAFMLDPLGPLITSEGPYGATLKVLVPEVPEGEVLVFGARPCSPGRRYCDKWKFLGLLSAPSGGASEITLLYYQKYGAPRPGSRVIILHPKPCQWTRNQRIPPESPLLPHHIPPLAPPYITFVMYGGGLEG